MWRAVVGAGMGGAVCFLVGSGFVLGLGWLAHLDKEETLALATGVGALVGVPGALAGAGAGRAGSPLPLLDEPNPDGPEADYAEQD